MVAKINRRNVVEICVSAGIRRDDLEAITLTNIFQIAGDINSTYFQFPTIKGNKNCGYIGSISNKNMSAEFYWF